MISGYSGIGGLLWPAFFCVWYNISKTIGGIMASFSQQMSKALKLIDPKKVNAAARGGLKKNRKKFAFDFANYMKKKTGLKRSIADIVKRLFFVFPSPKTFPEGTVDRIKVNNTQFSFLNFPNKIRQRRRKDGTFGSQQVLDGINIGKGFKGYQGVFVKKLGGNLLPLRSGKAGNIKSMQVNAYNIIANNESNFEAATNEYSKDVMVEIGKRMIRAMHKQVNKKVKFKVSKG
jgi:hypothetical protein